MKGALRGHYPVPGLKAVLGAMRRVPRTLIARRSVQRRRVCSDEDVLVFGLGQRTFFDAVRYEPIDRIEAEVFARSQLR